MLVLMFQLKKHLTKSSDCKCVHGSQPYSISHSPLLPVDRRGCRASSFRVEYRARVYPRCSRASRVLHQETWPAGTSIHGDENPQTCHSRWRRIHSCLGLIDIYGSTDVLYIILDELFSSANVSMAVEWMETKTSRKGNNGSV